MTETLYVSRKDLTSGEIIRELEAGNRVIVEVEVLGASMKMSLRRRKGTYYCDTPVKLLTYDTEAEMRRCLERYRLARPEPADITAEEPAESVGNGGS